MKLHKILFTIIVLTSFSMSAQLFNFSLRTNNQQLIDDALAGAFVRINQSYELCDTVNDAHFGRDGKDYFSIISFIGVETESGLLFPTATLKPWTYDKAFKDYQNKYQPLLTSTKITRLNGGCDVEFNSILVGDSIKHTLSILNNSTKGLRIDTVPGEKEGWIIWLSSNESLAANDTVRLTSIKKNIDVPIDGEHLTIDNPDISETVYGGVYVTPKQTAVGQITFELTGVMVMNEDSWDIIFPFIEAKMEPKILTPIISPLQSGKLNPLKPKKK